MNIAGKLDKGAENPTATISTTALTHIFSELIAFLKKE